MSLLQTLQNMISQTTGSLGDTGNAPKGGTGGGLSNLAGLLGPAVLGGLAGALMTNKTARKYAGSALLIGGGAALGTMIWKKYGDRVKEAFSKNPGASGLPATPEARAGRLVRALVFAAKSDGHIDAKEQQAIQDAFTRLNLGAETEQLVQEAIAQPLDPAVIAKDVHTEEEALEVYLISCAVIDVDHFMERSYLDALAQALNIPEDVKKGIEADVRQPA